MSPPDILETVKSALQEWRRRLAETEGLTDPGLALAAIESNAPEWLPLLVARCEHAEQEREKWMQRAEALNRGWRKPEPGEMLDI